MSMPITKEELATAQSLCTVTELRLINSSHGPALEKYDVAGLKKKIVLAREQRDKWKDLFTRQRRDVQKKEAARVNDKNERTLEKSQLFANALARFEEQLKKVVANPPTKVAAKKSVSAAPTKAQRVRTQRVVRARTKEQLKDLLPETPKKEVVVKKVATPEPVVPAKMTAPVPVKAKAVAKKVVKTKKAVKKPVGAPSTLAKGKGTKKAAVPTKSANIAAKQTRLKMSGKDTRVRGHVSAAGKRNQARRDTKR
jgi:hypothetical protein